MDKIVIRDSQTVEEFIETLKQFPQDYPIRICCQKGAEILVDEEYYDGDYANPKCPIIKAVIVE